MWPVRLVPLAIPLVPSPLLVTWSLCRAAAFDGDTASQLVKSHAASRATEGEADMEAMYLVFAVAALCCLGLLTPLLYAVLAAGGLLARLLHAIMTLIGRGAR